MGSKPLTKALGGAETFAEDSKQIDATKSQNDGGTSGKILVVAESETQNGANRAEYGCHEHHLPKMPCIETRGGCRQSEERDNENTPYNIDEKDDRQ